MMDWDVGALVEDTDKLRNFVEDTISRIVDFDDWGVSFEFFGYVEQLGSTFR